MAATGNEFAPLRQIKTMFDSIKASVADKLSKSEADDAYAAKTHTHTGTQVTGLAASRVVVSSSDGRLSTSGVSDTKLGYITGLTSDAQSQIDSIETRVSTLESASSSGGVDVVRTDTHKATYPRDTLEIVTDSRGMVTAMWFVSAS